jgi:transposase
LIGNARAAREETQEEVERKIEKLLQMDPTEEGENASRWTTPRIAEYLERELGVDVHPETVREALKRLEYSWTRPRRRLRKGPDYEERLARLAERIGSVRPETTVLFADETEVKRFPPLRRMWQPVGEQKAVWVPEQNGDFALYGALDICTGETYTEAFDREVSDHTIEFLKQVRSQTTGKVLLIWDQASWHTSKQVQGFLEDLGRFETLRLPKRAPEANPMEDLWRELKEQVAACLERSLDALRESCRRYFRNLSPQQALRTAGIGYE